MFKELRNIRVLLAVVLALMLAEFGAYAQESGGAITGAVGTENLTGEIRWKVSWGLPATDPTGRAPLSNICQPFSVSVVDSGTVISSDTQLTPGRADGEYYRCKYKLFAPRGRPIMVRPGINEDSARGAWFNGQKLSPATNGGNVKVPFGTVRLPPTAAVSRVFDKAEKPVTLSPTKGMWLTFELATPAEFSGRSYVFTYSQIEVPAGWSRTPLDWCREWGINCGKPAADAFCVSRGYQRAKKFEQGAKLPKTMTITEKRICTGSCDSFASIECVKE